MIVPEGEFTAARSRARRAARLALCALATLPAAAGAQAACTRISRQDPVVDTTRVWAPPLDHRVSLTAREESLRDALDRLAAAARIHLSYTAELLPLDRRQCAGFDAVPVGSALDALLSGVAVEPVAVAADQVVLAPAPPHAAATPRVRSPVGMLDRVVVTGSADGASERALPYAVDVVSGRSLEDHDASRFSDVLDANVPGLWLWNQSPSSLLVRYGSIRGASSFGLSYPKVYIDGIEVANPLLVTQLDPQMVERVEVIRGPQGAALYGADAISGVVNIVTRHDGPGVGAPAMQFRSGAGVAGSAWAPGGVLTQEHALAFRGGSGTRSAALGVTYNSLGAWVNGGYSRELNAMADARAVGPHAIVSGIARFYAADAGTAASPLLSEVLASASPAQLQKIRGVYRLWREPTGWAALALTGMPTTGTGDSSVVAPFDSAGGQSVREYTLGVTARLQQNARWSHSLVAGIDGYRLADASALSVPFPSPADSALRAARGSADRGTLRLTSMARFGDPSRTATTVTFGVEQGVQRVQHDAASYALRGSPVTAALPAVEWRSNTGFIGQGVASVDDALFVSAGMRVEHLSNAFDLGRFAALPMFGASYVRPLGGATVKFRAAWGKGIRAAQSTPRTTSWMGIHEMTEAAALAPEEQSGIEYGMDVLAGAGVALHLTRFDQRASGLIQPVSVAMDGSADDPTSTRRLGYELQNVGVITNRGWESQATWTLGALSLAGTFSTVDSRVRQVAPGYTGDLRPGDRMLEVPARTMSLTAQWVTPRWATSWTLSRATDWVNYDRLALAQSMATTTVPADEFLGAGLRSFWRGYAGVSRLRGTFTHTMKNGLALVFTGDNLLGQQLGEPDNVTILPGRTLTAGVRARF